MCINCGDCVKTCPTHALELIDNVVHYNKEKCVDCDTCIKTCKHLASPKITYMDTDEIIELIKQEIDFIDGITVSGGECMNHADFLYELFRKVKKLKKTCLIDSNGFYDFKNYEKLIALSDGVMLDVKAFDKEFHTTITSKDNETIINNLKYLKSINKLEEVRTVILPKYDKENIYTVSRVSEIIKDTTRYKLLRYRPFGVRSEGIDFFGNVIVDEQYAKKLVELAFSLGATKTVSV